MVARSLSVSPSIAALRWHFRRLVGKIGVSGTVGAGVLAFSAMYAANALSPLAVKLDELRQSAAHPVPVYQSTGVAYNTRLIALPQSFPARSDLLIWLDRLHEAANGNQLQIDIGEYKPSMDNTVFQTYELNFPVKANYVQLRGFLSQALADNPSLSLDHISFRRQKSSDTELNAEIRLTQYLKAD